MLVGNTYTYMTIYSCDFGQLLAIMAYTYVGAKNIQENEVIQDAYTLSIAMF